MSNVQNVSQQLFTKQLNVPDQASNYGCYNDLTLKFLSTCVDPLQSQVEIETAYQEQIKLAEYYKTQKIYSSGSKQQQQRIINTPAPFINDVPILNTQPPLMNQVPFMGTQGPVIPDRNVQNIQGEPINQLPGYVNSISMTPAPAYTNVPLIPNIPEYTNPVV